jgi:hypothetical protein
VVAQGVAAGALRVRVDDERAGLSRARRQGGIDEERAQRLDLRVSLRT